MIEGHVGASDHVVAGLMADEHYMFILQPFPSVALLFYRQVWKDLSMITQSISNKLGKLFT